MNKNDLNLFFSGHEKMVTQLEEVGAHERVHVRYANFEKGTIVISIEGADKTFKGMMDAVNFCRMTERMLIREVDFDRGEITIEWLEQGASKFWAVGLTDEEVDMLRHGKKINAIKSVRERTPMGLADAKNFVEDAMVTLRQKGVIR